MECECSRRPRRGRHGPEEVIPCALRERFKVVYLGIYSIKREHVQHSSITNQPCIHIHHLLNQFHPPKSLKTTLGDTNMKLAIPLIYMASAASAILDCCPRCKSCCPYVLFNSAKREF